MPVFPQEDAKGSSPLSSTRLVCTTSHPAANPCKTGGRGIRGQFGLQHSTRRYGRVLDRAVTCGVLHDSSADLLLGEGGDDIQAGFGGDDTFNEASGDDSLLRGEGNDSLSSGAGRDPLVGEAGSDTPDGQGGADTLCGSEGSGADPLDGVNGVAGEIDELFSLDFDELVSAML